MKDDTPLEQVTLRIPRPLVRLADRLIPGLAHVGGQPTRADVLREALRLGLDALKNDAGMR